MNFLRENPKDCQIIENRGKLSLRKEGVMEINQALELFNKLIRSESLVYNDLNKIINLSTIGLFSFKCLENFRGFG